MKGDFKCSSFLFGIGCRCSFFDHALGSLLLPQHADPLSTAACGQIIPPLGCHHFDLRRRRSRQSRGGKHEHDSACTKKMR